MEFRRLRANEIECRVAKISEKGLQLLLYKDARCDMNILDETVGQFDWQRKHEEYKGNIYCGVGIYFGGKDVGARNEWVWKWDAGAESYTEAVKGEASDSFKRACVNWGIGRELYTAPFIWIDRSNADIHQRKDGKFTCYDKFTVNKIEYTAGGKISFIEIGNGKKSVYTYGNTKAYENWADIDERDKSIELLKGLCEKRQKDFTELVKHLKLEDEKQITKAQFAEWSMKLSKEE